MPVKKSGISRCMRTSRPSWRRWRADRARLSPLLALCTVSWVALGAEPASDAKGPPRQLEATAEQRQALSRHYCQYLAETAASESALLWSPEVFSRFGTLHASGGAPADAQNVVSDRTLLSLQAGLELSPIRMRQGALVEARARAECRRYGAQLALDSLDAGLAPDPRAALAAKASALRAKLPQAEALLEQSTRDLAQARINLQRYTALRGHVQELRRSLEDTELELAAAAAPAGAQAETSNAPPLHELVAAEESVQSVEGRLRRLDAFDVNLRAGYERIFGLERSLPLFGSVTVRFAPGSFWQSDHESRAASARKSWAEDRVRQVRERVDAAAKGLAQQLAVSRQQQARLEADVAELQRRYAELERVKTPAAQDFQRELWFELARVEADLAFARSRSETLLQERTRLQRVLAP